MSVDQFDGMYREKVEQARQMSPTQRMRAGPELYDLWRKLVTGSVRAADPNASVEDVQREIHRRLEIARRLDESRCVEGPLYVDQKP